MNSATQAAQTSAAAAKANSRPGGEAARQAEASEQARIGGLARAHEAEHEAERTEAILGDDPTWTDRHRTATIYGTDPETGDMTMKNVYGTTYGRERPGTWPSRSLLGAANKAARIATKARRDDPTTEAIAAELVCRILERTKGAPLHVGTLSPDDSTQDGDRRTMAGMARMILHEAQRDGAGGLAAGIASSADSLDVEGKEAQVLTATEAATTSAANAADLTNPDPAMLAGSNPDADPLPEDAAKAADLVAAETGRGRKAAALSLRRILRPEQSAGQIAGAQISAGTAQRNAYNGMTYLEDTYACLRQSPATWSEADWRKAERLAALAEADYADRLPRPIMELGPLPYRKPKNCFSLPSPPREGDVSSRQASPEERESWTDQ